MVDIYLDSGDIKQISRFADKDIVKGFTTNPSLLKKSGITDYKSFAKDVLSIVKKKPVSFEVLSDDWDEMVSQANQIQSWGSNVWVKIPIVNTKGESTYPIIEKLSDLNLNITAIMLPSQIMTVSKFLKSNHIISVFCGRITDTQRPLIKPSDFVKGRWLWASTREVYSLTRAKLSGYHIITMSPELILKLPLEGKDLADYSRETVQQFIEDGQGLTL